MLREGSKAGCKVIEVQVGDQEVVTERCDFYGADKFYLFIIKNLHSRICVLILEREEGAERKTSIGCLPYTPHWDRTCKLGMCPDQESNLFSIPKFFGVQDDAPTN